MKRTLLKFSSAIYLIAFRKFSKAKHWDINLNALTVECDCTEKEAMFACKEFRAVILTSLEETGPIPKIGDYTVAKTPQRLTS